MNRSMEWRLVRGAVAAVIACGAACRRPDAPTALEPARDSRTTDAAMPLVEITFSGVNTSRVTSSARVASSVAELELSRASRTTGAAFDMTVPSGGNATIQLAPLSTNAFTVGGARYVSAVYRVRNAQVNEAPFSSTRNNLTFVAVSTTTTILDTPVRQLTNADGVPLTEEARQVLPSGEIVPIDDATVTAAASDVLQVLSETEVAAIAMPSAVTNVFPYGFVTRNANSATTRALDPSPAVDQFDGVVSFAFKFPVSDDLSRVPSRITVMMLGLDDSDVRLTQSLEEAGAISTQRAEVAARSLGASGVTLLPKGDLFLGAATERVFCAVRTAGFAGGETARMFPPPDREPWHVPSPYRPGHYFIQPTDRLAVARCPALIDVSVSSFAVHAKKKGRLTGQFFGTGASIGFAPTMPFLVGDEIEVSLTAALGGSRGRVARYVVGGARFSGANFVGAPTVSVGTSPSGGAIADFDRDGLLDVVIGHKHSNAIGVFIGRGDGTFAAHVDYPAGFRPTDPRDPADPTVTNVGDFNGDGFPDIVATNEGVTNVTILLNQGDGTFTVTYPTVRPIAVRGVPRSITVGDVNGDGHLDVVLTNASSGDVSVLFGNGDGTLQQRLLRQTPNSGGAVLGDVNRDGALDVMTLGPLGINVLLGNGNGTFQDREPVPLSRDAVVGALGDMNGDGALDLVFAENIGTVTVMPGHGDGTFGEGIRTATIVGPAAVVIADFNGDQRPDVAISSNAVPNISILIGMGDGTLEPQRLIAGGATALSLAAADMTNDGIIDLIPANAELHAFRVLIGVP